MRHKKTSWFATLFKVILFQMVGTSIYYLAITAYLGGGYE